MASKLVVWNSALREVGADKLSDTGETQERGYVLTDIYDNVVKECLEAGQWNFAIRAVKLVADTGIAPSFGFTEVFAKPTDWIRTVALSSSEYFSPPLTENDFVDEGGNFISSVTPIYLRYVSNDTGAGLDLASWPQSFTRYVELALADRICERLTQNASKKEVLTRDLQIAKRSALNKDAQNEGVKFPPTGSWVRSRTGGRGGERGNRNSFTG